MAADRLYTFVVTVAQLVRALDCGSRGRGFESGRLDAPSVDEQKVPLVEPRSISLNCLPTKLSALGTRS